MKEGKGGACPLPGAAGTSGRITLGHGSGGRMSAELVRNLFARCFSNRMLDRLDDSARMPAPDGRLAFSTDTFVVDPLFFPGGDIGELAVNGTVNDLAMSGARPLWLSCGFVIEEGFPLSDLERVCVSMARAAERCGVEIVTGDTKVVGRGGCDGLFINTSGIGVIAGDFDSGPEFIRPGDAVIVSGPLGSHGMAVMMARGQLSFASEIRSDTAPLHELALALVERAGDRIRVMRDATRGGAGAVLAELAEPTGFSVLVGEVPVPDDVAVACDILGIDPLFVANEGRMVVIAAADAAGEVLALMREHESGRDAAVMGEVVEDPGGRLLRLTPFGSRQIITVPAGELLPRIC